ncbi:MAG: NAD(P)/FAD-dependent oxidoreductase [Christensenellales bacterium]|jgi:NADPH-dependent 2,4-dienoyl-CoA reductase/sulfur reductase-like enzyme
MADKKAVKKDFAAEINCDVAVIGGGPAGLAAAIFAHEKGAKVILIERDKKLGGILQQCIHNGFGLHYFGEELTGPEYAGRFADQVLKTDIDVLTDTMALSVGDYEGRKKIKAVSAEKGMIAIEAKAVILAMGCRERTRGALNIAGSRPAGIYTAGCAQRLVNMDGYMPGKRVVILGSGDIGLIMARRMTWEGAKVEMVCEIMPYSSGLGRNIAQCLDDNEIPLHFNTTVVRIHGKERLEGVTIAKVDENRVPVAGTERFVACDTLLLSVGLLPENELTQEAGIAMDPVTGGALVDGSRQTSAAGIFACGNVLHVHDLVDNVSVEARLAGEAAADYAAGKFAPAKKEIAIRPGENVRYVVPHRISLGSGETKATLYLRVKNAVKPAELSVFCGEERLARKRAMIMTPGEMITVDVTLNEGTDGEIVVSVSEVKR